MTIIVNLLIFIFGLIIGSFLNCVIYRLEIEKSVTGRSFCPDCKHTLYWYDLIPVLSFIGLRGKCRYCGKKISWQYPIVEISTALIFLLIFNFFAKGGPAAGGQNLLNIGYLLITASLLIIIFVYDLKHFLIPDIILFPAIVVVFLYRILEVFDFEIWKLFGMQPFGESALRPGDLEFGIFYPLLTPFLSAILTSAFFLAIFSISRGRAMGFGDVKLVFFMGLFLGWPGIFVALFLASLLGAIIGIGLILAKKKTIKSEIPFGPFLITGAFISFFWSQNIINWYFSLFFR